MAASETLPLNEMGIFPVSDSEVTQCVTYLCNLAFSDVLDECKNGKFPGGLAVSLSRELLPRLRGHKSHHLAYESTDILSWISPVERVIPPMQLGGDGGATGGKRTANSGVRPSTLPHAAGGSSAGLDVLQLDFGSALLGLFEVLPLVCICPLGLDFGSSDGLFRIV